MPGTRSSARLADKDVGSSPPSAKSSAGTKRKADDAASPSSNKTKRGRPSDDQKTLEETMPDNEHAPESKDAEMSEAKPEAHLDGGKESERPNGCWGWIDKVTYDQPEENGANGEAKGQAQISVPGESFEGKTREGEPKEDPEKALKDSRGGPGVNALEKVKADEKDEGRTKKKFKGDDESKDEVEEKEAEKNGDGNESSTNPGEAVEDDKEREAAMPSNILEKGIIYFFSRGRVGVDDPDSVQDLARSYFVLRPLPAGGKLTDGVIQDVPNHRLFALPKKVWPKSGKDRFMVFVEKANASIKNLKEEFFAGSEYSTKTTGTRQTPEVTPLGEGVYAITSTGSGRPTTHLVYMMTIPEKIGEVQTDVGLAEKGSFVISLKNPESTGPAYAQLPEKPEFPKEFIEEFSGRGWMPAHPKHLDYPNAQMLLIGEDFDSSSNLDPTPKDEKNKGKQTPQEELEELEDEDEHRVEHLRGDDTIFADLGISRKDYPKVMTTW